MEGNIIGARKVSIDEIITVSISASWTFGFILYMVIKQPERLKKEGRNIVMSKEGLVHLALSIGSVMAISSILNWLDFYK